MYSVVLGLNSSERKVIKAGLRKMVLKVKH